MNYKKKLLPTSPDTLLPIFGKGKKRDQLEWVGFEGVQPPEVEILRATLFWPSQYKMLKAYQKTTEHIIVPKPGLINEQEFFIFQTMLKHFLPAVFCFVLLLVFVSCWNCQVFADANI